jgi:hypothetical protein
MTRLFYGHDKDGTAVTWTEPAEPTLRVSDFGGSFLVYVLTERTETSTDVEVEVVVGEGDNVQARTFTVDDSEPLDVWGLIFGRIFDEMGLTLSDPGDFLVEDLSKPPNGIEDCFEVTINCPFTEVSDTSDTDTKEA